MSRKIQLDEEVFNLIYTHFCDPRGDISDEDFKTVSEALRAKKQALVMHEYYSKAKDPKKSPEERLKWMQLYKTTKAAQPK